MNKLSLKTLKLIRNIIIIAGIAGGLIIWLGVPDMILNNRLVHVGNGRYGSKIGMLIILGLPLFSLFPYTVQEEIHSDDEAERAKLEEEAQRANVSTQISLGIFRAIVVWFIMFAAILLC